MHYIFSTMCRAQICGTTVAGTKIHRKINFLFTPAQKGLILHFTHRKESRFLLLSFYYTMAY